MDEPETQVRLEVVEAATMSSPIFRAEPVGDIVPEWAEVPESAEPLELPPIAISRRVGFEIAVIAAVGVAATFLTGDARAALVVGSLASRDLWHPPVRPARHRLVRRGLHRLPQRPWMAARGPGG